jgi:glutathione S-transferase
MSLPLLYSGTKNASSWAMRAWLALREARVEFDEVVVDIRRPVRFPNLRAFAGVSPAATVPLLLVGDHVLFDSLAIMEFANDCCGGNLLPEARPARGAARSLLAWQHAGLSGICSRISFESAFYPLKRVLTGQEQREAERLFDHTEGFLCASGPFLFDALSLADLALAPTLIRLARHNIDLDRHALSRGWVERVLALPSVQEWMSAADELPHIWYDEYLAGKVPLQWDMGALTLGQDQRLQHSPRDAEAEIHCS